MVPDRARDRLVSDALDLDHEPETVGDLAALDGLVGLDAGHAVSVPGALGLGTVAVGIQFLRHAGWMRIVGYTSCFVEGFTRPRAADPDVT